MDFYLEAVDIYLKRFSCCVFEPCLPAGWHIGGTSGTQSSFWIYKITRLFYVSDDPYVVQKNEYRELLRLKQCLDAMGNLRFMIQQPFLSP